MLILRSDWLKLRDEGCLSMVLGNRPRTLPPVQLDSLNVCVLQSWPVPPCYADTAHTTPPTREFIQVSNVCVCIFNPFRPEFTIVISSTTSHELLSQFSTCSGWRWLEVGDKWKKISLLLKTVSKNVRFKTPRCRKLGHSSEMQNDALMHHQGLKG